MLLTSSIHCFSKSLNGLLLTETVLVIDSLGDSDDGAVDYAES